MLNKNESTVRQVMAAVVRNGGYCPCKPEHKGEQDYLCPCKTYRTTEECCCSLYVKEQDEIDEAYIGTPLAEITDKDTYDKKVDQLIDSLHFHANSNTKMKVQDKNDIALLLSYYVNSVREGKVVIIGRTN
jgi:ferredoxin-thioredoxin reductase catalytic subunit